MKGSFKLSAVAIADLLLFFVSVSFAQIEEKKEDFDDFAPPYNKNTNTIQKEIEEWIAREKANASKKDTYVALKTDVLGRSLSSGTVELIKKARKASPSEQKRLVVISDLHLSDEPIEKTHERYEYDAATGLSKYYIDDKEINEKDYLDHKGKAWEKFNEKRERKRNLYIPGVIKSNAGSWTAWITAEELSNLLDKNKELTVRDYIEPQNTSSRDVILDLTQLSSHAFPNNQSGKGIGIYYEESGCILSGGGVNTSNFSQMNTCGFHSLAHNAHATAVVRTLQMASPDAKIYGYFAGSPNWPFSGSPKIEIGSQSWQVGTSNIYSISDSEWDDHIYKDGILEFISAGNECGTNGSCNVTSPGKAVNAITVGAVRPEDGYYADYSSWRNSDVKNEKPEVAAYTNIDFSDNSVLRNYFNVPGVFSGTSAATPLLAGFMANMVQQYDFVKNRPAVLKALCLTGSTEPIKGNHDLDNSRSAKNLIPYSSIAWNTILRYWQENNSYLKNDITFTEKVDANKRYRIAIAWLTPAKYVLDNTRLSQDIDLTISQNGNIIANSWHIYNPFELVEFVTTSNAPITIRIHRARNSIGAGDNLFLGFSMWARH
jgi:hypothetical protein